MATGNSNQLIVEVIGDTSQLTRDLKGAESQINRFANRTSRIKTTGADSFLAEVRASRVAGEELTKQSEEAGRQADIVSDRLGRTALRAGVAGLAIHVLGQNMAETGGKTGQLGSALQQLATGNVVGFVKTMGDNSAAAKKFQADLIATGDATKAFSIAQKLSGTELDVFAQAAKNASIQIQGLTQSFVDNTKIRDSSSPGVIANEVSGLPLPKTKKRAGVSQTQLNQFFDNDLTRALDRVQDSTLSGQIAKLRQIAATISERISVTKDITRRLRLEDSLAGVTRQRRRIEDTIAKDAADRAEAARVAAANLAKQRAARAKALEEARALAIQSKQFRALGFAPDGSDAVAGVGNLRKQLASLTSRIGDTSLNLSTKLQSQLAGARKVLAGEFGKTTRESRSRIQELFDTIRGEFDKGAKGPLTKTTSINAASVLGGLGLDRDQIRSATARLSRFNSGGIGLAAGNGSVGAFGQPIIVQPPPVFLDGQKISQNTRRNNTVHARRNPKQKRGRRF